jgi:hypothetical protein
MKNYIVQAADGKLSKAIEAVLEDGGFVKRRTKQIADKGYIIHTFYIEANDDQEFAELFVDVGKALANMRTLAV